MISEGTNIPSMHIHPLSLLFWRAVEKLKSLKCFLPLFVNLCSNAEQYGRLKNITLMHDMIWLCSVLTISCRKLQYLTLHIVVGTDSFELGWTYMFDADPILHRFEHTCDADQWSHFIRATFSMPLGSEPDECKGEGLFFCSFFFVFVFVMPSFKASPPPPAWT